MRAVLVPALLMGLVSCSVQVSVGDLDESDDAVVASVTDGDTLRLESGDAVRIVGIDTPERGQCGFERAARALERLVLGEAVTLTAPVDDRDRYDRLLRYVDVDVAGQRVDAGLRLIEKGLAVARYDSRDGYDRHPREEEYRAADRAVPDVCRWTEAASSA